MTIAELYKILFYTSVLIWLIPPIRQFKGKFFYFFLILALMDPIFLINNIIFKKGFPIQLTVFLVYLLFISIIQHDIMKKHKLLFVAVGILIIIMAFFGLNQTQNFVVVILLHAGIFLIILKIFITNFGQSGKVGIFYLVFVFYELTMILKLFNVLIGFADAIGFYMLTSIAQIIFGLFFSIYREIKAGSTV